MQNFFANFDLAGDSLKSTVKAILTPLNSFFEIFSNFWIGAVLITTVFLCMLTFTLLKFKKNTALKNPRTVAICSMMIAINVILGYFTLNLSSYLRVGFGFITLPVVAMFFGPAAALISGTLQDLISFILKPTGGYLFTLTLNVGISGMIYGFMLYKKKITFLRVFFTKLLIIVVVNIILNSIGLSATVGSGLIGILPARIIKNIILLPIQSVIVYLLLKSIQLKKKEQV